MNRWILLLAACALVAQSLVFAWVTRHPDPDRFGYELGLGLLLGCDHCVPSSPLERGIPLAAIGLIASVAGLMLGFIVGWLVRSGSGLIRRDRSPSG